MERDSSKRLRPTSNKPWNPSKTNKSDTIRLLICVDPLPVRFLAFLVYIYRTISSVKSKSLPSKRAELTKAEKELAGLNDDCAKIHQQVREGRGQVEEARSALQAHRSRGQVLQALVEQRESGAIPGIHGRLVRLCVYVCVCVCTYMCTCESFQS